MMKCCTLSRWMIHRRPHSREPNFLRAKPSSSASRLEYCALHCETVEIAAGPCNGYVMVQLALTAAQGWLKEEYLHECPEGTPEHGRLSSEAKAGDREVWRMELRPSDKRFREVNRFLYEGSDGRLAAAQVWFISGHFLGETGMSNGPKTTLFHGTSKSAVDAIVQTGFDDNFAADGKFGKGLYFSPEALTSYGYGRELLLCEVSLGSEDQRITATETCSDYTWTGLLNQGKRSVQCHADVFGQEERIVYHCTQCKPVYVIKVKRVKVVLPRWMVHQRRDSIPKKSSLRREPSDNKNYVGSSALNGEVVEVLDRSGPTNDYILVRLAVSETEGWIKAAYLQECQEGTREHGRLAATESVKQEELPLKSSRVKELQDMITRSMCSNPSCHCCGIDITIKRAWFVTGQFLGETGMKTGPKTTLFHGCPDDVVQPIAQGGFDDHFSSGGAFGKGCYFSPQACKAFSYAQNYLLVCEVALGAEANRLTLTTRCRSMDYDTLRGTGKRSVQCHAGAPFNHEERIVYHPTQCKPVYIIETTTTSPGGGV